jgi:hypothetical protein
MRWNSTGSVVQIVFNTRMHSSAHWPRSCHGTPAASYSSGDHPMPNPTPSRPPDSTSRVLSRWMALAFLSGLDIEKRIATNLSIIAAAVGITYTTGTVANLLWGISL